MCAPARAAEPQLFVLPAVLTNSLAGDHAELARGVLGAPAARELFATRFRAAYPNVVQRMSDGDRLKTFVVSLQVPRVSEYSIPKANGTVERQLAMTGSLYFTNVVTGEVLFSYTATAYRSDTALQSAGPPPEALQRARLHDLYDALLADLVGKSRAAFRPFEITAAVKGFAGELVILDKGAAAGVGVDDSFLSPDGELRVVFAEAQYAVAQPQLGGRPAAGSQWSKISTNRLGEIDRPRAVVRVAANGSPFADAALEQMFADALGEKAPLNLVPVNASYSAVVDSVRQLTDLRADRTTGRRLPDYFVRLSVAPTITFVMPTNVAHKTVRVTQGRVLAEIVDRNGRVQYAGFGEDTLQDEITGGMGYDGAARAEVAVRNAILDLARKMGAQLKLDRADLRVQAASGGTVTIADPKGLLRVGAAFSIVRPAAPAPYAPGGVLAPIWSGQVTSTTEGSAGGELALPVYAGAPAVRAGDVVRVATVGAPPVRTPPVRPCSGSETLGARRVTGFEPLALNRFASAPGRETELAEFAGATAEALAQTGQFEAAAPLGAAGAAMCVEPVSRVDLVKEACDERGVCTSEVALRVTYRLKRDAEVVFRSGLETTVRTRAYYSGVAPAEREALIDADVASAAATLLRTLAEKSDFQQALSGR
ncbi:hypothetical protein [Phenylobacterium sp.]|uniref:hypothetical protein n=1 Tax=Phenylobacterium sp. TaxID=1871053 RepID=UPI002C8110BB|nr:hypothetical protein [Phenylobacterium sp.]HVI31037.1 hypothetical protein [Phenylobacterium sp.]